MAATNASLAWLGGGTLASGGTGVLGGTLVLGTGIGAIVIGGSIATLYVFQLYDEHQDNIRLQMMLEYLAERKTF